MNPDFSHYFFFFFPSTNIRLIFMLWGVSSIFLYVLFTNSSVNLLHASQEISFWMLVHFREERSTKSVWLGKVTQHCWFNRNGLFAFKAVHITSGRTFLKYPKPVSWLFHLFDPICSYDLILSRWPSQLKFWRLSGEMSVRQRFFNFWKPSPVHVPEQKT